MKEPQEWMWKGIAMYAIAALVLGDLVVSVAGIVLGAAKLGESFLATWALMAGIANVCQLCFVGSFAVLRYQRCWWCGCAPLVLFTAIFCFAWFFVGFVALVENESSSALVGVSVCLDVACLCWIFVYAHKGFSQVRCLQRTSPANSQEFSLVTVASCGRNWGSQTVSSSKNQCKTCHKQMHNQQQMGWVDGKDSSNDTPPHWSDHHLCPEQSLHQAKQSNCLIQQLLNHTCHPDNKN